MAGLFFDSSYTCRPCGKLTITLVNYAEIRMIQCQTVLSYFSFAVSRINAENDLTPTANKTLSEYCMCWTISWDLYDSDHVIESVISVSKWLYGILAGQLKACSFLW